MEKSAKIEKGRKVRVEYTVKVDGKVVESTLGKPPLYYEHGKPHVLPAMQRQLEGLREGDQKSFELEAADAYGPHDEARVQLVDYAELPPRSSLVPGMTLQETQPDGSVKVGRVVELRENGALLDFNHPMAGRRLCYQVKIISVMSGEGNPDIFPHMRFE